MEEYIRDIEERATKIMLARTPDQNWAELLNIELLELDQIKLLPYEEDNGYTLMAFHLEGQSFALLWNAYTKSAVVVDR